MSATLVGGTAQTQQATKVYRVGALFNRAPNQEDRDVEILKEGLARLGYVEGSNLVIEAGFAEGNLNRLPVFAAELVGLGVDVIAAYGGPPTRAARAASTSIPIVANLVADPIALGYAATLERPGGNVTGITNHDPDLATLQLTILREVFPTLERVAFLSDADIPGTDSTGFVPIERSNIAAAATMKITPQVLKLRGPEPDFDAAFSTWILPLLGIIFLPFATLMYVILYTPGVGLTGWDWFWVTIAALLDIGQLGSSAAKRRGNTAVAA